MELTVHKPSMQMGKSMGRAAFAIGDEAMIVEVVRDRMYSVPIRTVCQEVTSNARDAHRELGNPEVPIEIHLPSLLDKRFWVRDFGIGVDPERMANVFIKYGKSTKRGSNTQTGGFGLGAKSPFSYQDTFQIETYIPEEDGKVYLRRYVAIIEESRIGALYEVSEQPEPTDEPRGTKIILTCKPNDETHFARWVENATRHWEVRPNVIGGEGDFEWDNEEYYFEGERWAVLKHGSRCALVDGIPYPLDTATITAGLDSDDPVRKSFSVAFQLKFDTGEVGVAANREALDYRSNTLPAIHKLLRRMMDELGKEALAKIETADSLWDANIILRDLPSIARDAVGKKAKWKGFPVLGDFMMKGAKTLVATIKQSYRTERIQIKRETTTYFNFLDTPVYFYDEKYKHPSRARLLNLFHTDGIETVRIIMFPRRGPGEEDLAMNDAIGRAEGDDTHGLGVLLSELPRFSTINKWKTTRSKSAGGNLIPKIKILGLGNEWTDADAEYDFESEDELVFVQLKGGEPYKKPGLKGWTRNSTILQIQNTLDITIVGVQTPYIKRVPDHWVWADDAVQEKFLEIRTHPNADEALAYVPPGWNDKIGRLSNLKGKISNGEITPPQGGLLDRWAAASKENAELISLCSRIEEMARLANVNVESGGENLADVSGVIKDAVHKAMPFLSVMEKTSYGQYPANEVQWYITLKEAEAAAAKVKPEEEHLAKMAHQLAKSNGGTMSWRQVEAALKLPSNNGMSAVRLARKYTPPANIFDK
jgi:hypothetical protein